MKRWLIVGSALMMFLGVVCTLAAFLFWPRPAINRQGYEAIQMGMTQHEVELVLGTSRNECRGPVDVWVRRGGATKSAALDPGAAVPRFFPEEKGGQELLWLGKDGLIAVHLGDDGRVRDKYFSTVNVIVTPREAFLRSLGL